MIIPLQKVDYPDFKHNSHEHESIELKENYLTYKNKSSVEREDDKTALKREFYYDCMTTINKSAIHEIEFGYSNQKEKYEVTISSQNPICIVFPAKEEALKTYNALVEWRWK